MKLPYLLVRRPHPGALYLFVQTNPEKNPALINRHKKTTCATLSPFLYFEHGGIPLPYQPINIFDQVCLYMDHAIF